MPLTVDGPHLIKLDGHAPVSQAPVRVPALAPWLLALGILATLAANVMHGLSHGREMAFTDYRGQQGG